MWTRFFDGQAAPQMIALALMATLAAAWIAARIARRLAAAALRALVRDTLSVASPQVRGPLRIVGAAAFILVIAILLFPAFEMVGLKPRAGVHLNTLSTWLFGPGLKILLTVLIAQALVRMTTLLVRRFEHEMSVGTNLDAIERGKRARTLGSVVRNVVTVLVIGIALLMVLGQFGLDITPVLTTAGIAGLAVGFGAQTLVRDIISGFFLILENQVRVGDAAGINGTDGIVEAINTLANRSKDYSYYVLELSVSYYDDSDRIAETVREVGASLQADPAFGPAILAPIEVLGVDAFTEWSVKMKARIKTVPLKQWEVGRELRRRIIKAFAQRGFAVPFPVPATAAPPLRPATDQ